MKITKRQLKRIIKEEMLQGNDLEAFYALIYAAQYVTRYSGSLRSAWYKFQNSPTHGRGSRDYRKKSIGYSKITNALEKLDTSLLNPIMDLEAAFDAPPAERDSIETEAYDGALIDFREDVFNGVEEIERMINNQTPIGMSVSDALNHFVQGSLPITATQEVVSLMDDDDVLNFMDGLSDL